MSREKLYLVHILESIELIEEYTLEGEEAFYEDRKTQDAVIRNLQVLSESTQRLSDEIKQKHPGIDWSSVSAFRNILVHDYLGVDIRQIWKIISKDLSELKSVIQNTLADFDAGNN